MAETASAERRAALRSVSSSAGARLLVLPVSAGLGIVVARSLIDGYGQQDYAQYMLLVGIAALIPFADLGISAAIMNAVAEAGDPRNDDRLHATLVTCIRILAASASVLAVTAAVLTSTGSWHVILGAALEGRAGNLAAGLCLGMMASAMLVGFGQRLLIGLGLTHVSIFVGALQTPLVLATILVALSADLRLGPYVAVASYAALVVTGGVSLWLANRRIRPAVGRAFRSALRLRSERGGQVFDTAWPMLVQMVALPLAMQSDRLVLSHVSTVDQLATFSLASQMYTPVLSVSLAATMALWPVFARQRGRGGGSVSARRMSLLFALVGGVCALAVSLAAGPLASLASAGTIGIPVGVLVVYSLLVVVQAAQSPLGMYLTDARGLRYQAGMVTLMLPVNVGISVVLAREYGAVGPIIGSVVSVAVFQLVANWLYVARREAAATGRSLA